MNYSIKILESNNKILNDINKALLPDITKFMNNAIAVIKTELPMIVRNAIVSSPEYISLISGQLKYELGIIDGAIKVEGLLNIWMSNIEYIYDPPSIVNNRIKSKFSASLIRADLSDVLYTEYAQMTDNMRGYSLPWLEWLLLNGTIVLVNNYEVILGPNKYSRTGYGIMSPGGGWSVPSQFAGTTDDNWITRSIDVASEEVNSLLQKAFKQ